MPKSRCAGVRRRMKPSHHGPVRFNQQAPPAEEDLTLQEMAEIERMLVLMASAECEVGCDYPDGPMSPGGCRW